MADRAKTDGELSLVSAGTTIEGKIKTEGSVRIDGKLIGEVVAKANAAIGITGIVEGMVVAKSISVAGKIKGNVTAADKLTLEANSVMHGDIKAARLVVDEGAMFDGECAMTTQSGDSRESHKRDH